MACGKTTLGRALARRLNREFIDLDFYIEQRFRRSIPQIFATEGEARFRRMETSMLHETGEMCDVIIACGGGTPCFGDNMDYMLDSGTVIFLDTTIQRIVERLIINRRRRPLLADKSDDQLREAVISGLNDRLATYRRAHIIHPGTHLETLKEIDATVTSLLPLLPE